MRIGKLGLFLLPLALSAAPAAAQPSLDVDVNVTMPGEPVASVDVFYDQLSPYGVWVDDADMGRVYLPDQANYVPYTNGHWEYTDLGFVWVSTEPFGWATSHYGRWAFSQPYGRWVWMPDTTWGPAWVDWRESDDGQFGWSPLAPQVVVDLGYQPPVEAWHFCPADRVLDVNVNRYYAPRDRVVVIERQARPIESRRRVNNREVVAGPPPAKLQEHRVVARATKLDTRKVGLMSATEARAATQRAEQRKATVLAANEKRVESNTKLRAQVQEAKSRPRGQKIEAKNEPRQPAPAPRAETRPEPKQPRIDTKAKPTEPKPAPRAETRPEPKPPTRVEPKAEPKPAPRAENRPEPKQPAPRVEPHDQPKPAAPHAENRPEPKRPQQAENRPAPKRDDKKRD